MNCSNLLSSGYQRSQASRLLLAAALAVTMRHASAARASIVYWDPAQGGNGHYYELVEGRLRWAEARIVAMNRTHDGRHGHLATVTSQAENDFIQSQLNFSGLHAAWIGLTDDEAYGGMESGGAHNFRAPFWVWVTGETVDFTNWVPGEPNNLFGDDYGEFVFDVGGLWNDLPDFEPHLRSHYLVEYPISSVPEPSSLALCGLAIVPLATLALWRSRRRRGIQPTPEAALSHAPKMK